ncbi:MAG: DUF4446 family protein [Actinomycetota bacterium]|nr:DUF4446 family protein [Actinomycetota bacterium]
MTTLVAVFAMVLAYVALVAAYFALRTLAKLRRASATLGRGVAGERGRQSLVEASARHSESAAVLSEQLADLRAHVDQSCADVLAKAMAGIETNSSVHAGALRNVALVRYDAFGDISGRMSFSLALLDDNGDGISISAIAGNTDTRVYAKGVAAGVGEHDLSPEERQAVDAALNRHRKLLSRKAG